MCSSDPNAASGGKYHSETLALGGDSSIRMVRIESPLDVHVSCTTGMLWITQLGDRNDYVLGPGESRRFGGKEAVVINPLRSSICAIASETASALKIRMEGHTAVVRRVPSGLATFGLRSGLRGAH